MDELRGMGETVSHGINAVHLSQVNGIFVARMQSGALVIQPIASRISSGLPLSHLK
jgi:hypothetical protein